MKYAAQIALTVVLLAMAAACHKDNKAAQLQALDEAYKSGVFTKEEYDAKKQAILGPPAAAPAAPAPAASPAAPAPAAPAPAGAIEPAPPANPPAAAPPVAATPPPVIATPAAPAGALPPPKSAPPVSAPPPPAQPAPQSAPASPPPSAPPVEQAEPEPAPLAGCQDAESRAGGPNGVQERFYPASEDVVRQAAVKAFTNLDFAIHTSTGHEIEASKKRHLSAVVGAGGERVILHFASARQGGQAGTRVTGETRKSIVGRLSQKSWTTAVLAQIGCNLRAGR
jgi:hypothetical protein